MSNKDLVAVIVIAVIIALLPVIVNVFEDVS